MNPFRNWSIRAKQTLIIMLTSSIALLLACAAFIFYDTATFRSELVEKESSMAEIVGNASTAALDFNDHKTAAELLTALRAEPNVEAACIYDHNGQIFATYRRDAGKNDFKFPPVQPAGHEFTNENLRLFRPIRQGEEITGTIFITSDLTELSDKLARYAGIAGLVFGASLLIALAISSRLQRVVSNPILHLAQVARSVALDKNYAVRATKKCDDELGQLVDGFNEMLAQIQQRDAALEVARSNLERRVAERTKELAESQLLYHSLVEQMPAGIFRKDAAGRYVFVNSWFCRTKGLKPEQILGKTARELAAGEMTGHNARDSQEIELTIQGARHHELIMETGEPIEVDEEYRAVDGQRHFLHVVKSPVYGPDERMAGTQGMLFDVSERKRAEAALSNERELLRALLDYSPDYVYFKDLESRFIKGGKAQAGLFGMKDASELLGKTDFDFFAVEHARPAFEDEQEVIRTGHPLIGKVEKTKLLGGQFNWALTSKMPLRDKDGQIIGTFGISKDITELKETEAKLEQVHKQLLATSRAAGMAEVASNVLHNVGNVLNSVNVSATLIAEGVKKSKATNLTKVVALFDEHTADLASFITTDPKGQRLPDYLRELGNHIVREQDVALTELESLKKNIGHIKEIVSMQQSYAKVSGQKETVNIIDLVEDSLRMNSGALLRHGVNVVRHYEKAPPVNVEKHKVLQVLVNVIRNAKYACDESGRLDKQMTVRVTYVGDRVSISVTDNGVGIPAENLVRIFNHGFTTRKSGHGFGLHSSALAAKEMGGSLRVQSDGAQCGATFTLELPVNNLEKS